MGKEYLIKGDDFQESIGKSSEIIRSGGIIAFPTETVYGIGCDIFNIDAVKKIYEIKGRSFNKPLAAYLPDLNSVFKVATDFPKGFFDLAEKFLPGPLTIILKKKDEIHDLVTSDFDTIGIRIPDNPFMLKFLKDSGLTLAGTSANLSGGNSPVNPEDIDVVIKDNINAVINDGPAILGVESSVLDMSSGTTVLLREGYIKRDLIEDILKMKIG